MNTKKMSRLFAGTVAIAGLVLTGCAGGTDTATPGSAGSSSVAAAQGQQNDADVKFAQGMIPHHRQAVEMAELAASRTQNPQVLDLAARIGAAQAPEIRTMTGWLTEWGAEVPADDGTAGMEHSAGMGGMMTSRQIQELEQARGTAFDRMFLEMMTEHHKGAVEMAQTELEKGADPEAKALAQTIISAQQGEISEMETLLQQV